MAETDPKKLTIGSSFDDIDQLEPYLEGLQEQTGFSDEKLPQIRLALNEAVTNAITHGNQNDPSKEVHILATGDQNQLTISVKDEGRGFNPDNLSDPLKEENLLKESGRGIFLIKENADQVEFSESATKITMIFKLADS